jgi:hypothetical protein
VDGCDVLPADGGTVVTCDDAAVLPAITIDLAKEDWQIAPSVSSTDVQ